MKLKPDYVNALDSRGFVRLRAGQYDNAIADYDAALKLEPNKVASLYGRGMAKRRKGDYAAGKALGNCQRSGQACRLYAVDDAVVWRPN